jgi:hypothetical protein
VVIFLNLKPNDLRHGEVTLYAGRHYVDNGTLSNAAVQRIFERDMQPPLAAGRTADGIGAGLDGWSARLPLVRVSPANSSRARLFWRGGR